MHGHGLDMQDPAYLNARGVSFAVWCQGPYEEFAPFREFMGYRMPWYSLHGVSEPGVFDGWLNAHLRIGDRLFLTYATAGRGREVRARGASASASARR